MKLTDEQRYDRDLKEADLQRLVTDLATIYGWSWVHFRHAQTAKGWRVPVEGPLGKGWPDLVLVHPGQQRTLYVELKRQKAELGSDQEWVGGLLTDAGAEYEVWRPEDLRTGCIQETLEGARARVFSRTPTWHATDYTVVDGVATLPDGRRIESTAQVVRVLELDD